MLVLLLHSIRRHDFGETCRMLMSSVPDYLFQSLAASNEDDSVSQNWLNCLNLTQDIREKYSKKNETGK